MELPVNKNQPDVMHIDLNSCFATVEQQANIHLRNKPVVIAAYDSPSGCVVSPSIEAKRFGIKTGMSVRESRLLCKDVVVRTPDPPLVRDVHIKFKKIFKDYSPNVYPQSIDEAIIDFKGMEHFKLNLVEIAQEIKIRLKKEVGEWILCSVGISTNRFLAKLGASIKKPDGLVVIDHKNLIDIYKSTTLLDFCGINTRFQARLNANGIFNPIDFLKAKEIFLRKNVFNGILGYYWYLRLRGWEIDDVNFSRKSFGQNYSLPKPILDSYKISRILMKLCEKMGRRLRCSGFSARGIHVSCIYNDWSFWHRGRKIQNLMYTTSDLYIKAQWILNQQPEKKPISKISVSCYDITPSESGQIELFDVYSNKKKVAISCALDKINDKYGEFVITPALMLDMENEVVDRVAFGGVKELEDLYI